jgi:hypothetical protein
LADEDGPASSPSCSSTIVLCTVRILSLDVGLYVIRFFVDIKIIFCMIWKGKKKFLKLPFLAHSFVRFLLIAVGEAGRPKWKTIYCFSM